MASSGFVEIDHTADWALRVRGTDLADLLAQAAGGMVSLTGAHPRPDAGTRTRTLRLSCDDRESLLVRWLEEVLFLLESEALMPRGMRLQVDRRTRLTAGLDLSPLGGITRSIKAVTFHGLRITDTPTGPEATLVFDV